MQSIKYKLYYLLHKSGETEMFNNRRSEIEIVSEILTLSRDGVKKTTILYQNNLSYTQLQNYLPFLLEKKFLEEITVEDNGNSYKSYKTTDNGLKLLEDIQKVISHLH
jgi:predicted transcriptional regulator